MVSARSFKARNRISIVKLVIACLTSSPMATATLPSSANKRHADPMPGVDWESFNFGLNGVETDAMWVSRTAVEQNGLAVIGEYDDLEEQCLQRSGKLEISPSATVLNYGQALFEGLKAFRRQDGSIVMFRPEMNAARMQQGACRFLMPSVPTTAFVKACDAVVRANSRWVPPYQKGALYLRPLLMGTGAALGVKPSSETTFCIYCSPVGDYFKAGLKAIRLQAVKGYSRAAPGGSGAIKASGNYAPAFEAQRLVRLRGYDEVLCLDAISGEVVEEAGASNFFAVFPNGTIVTPSLDTETILPGVTRASIIELAEKELGCHVVEGRLTLSDLQGASEAFCCGTGACITPVGCLSVVGGDDETKIISFGDGTHAGDLTRKLYTMLTDIQTGCDPTLCEKYKHWIHVVAP